MTKGRGAIPYLLLVSLGMLISWFPSQAGAQAVTFDAASSTDTGAGTAISRTFSHTTSGANRILMVGVSIFQSSGQTVSSITYAGTNLTLVGTVAYPSEVRVEMWRLIAPATGTNNVVVTMSGAAAFVAGAASFTNVHQTTPLGSFFSSSGDGSTPPSLAVTGVNANEMVVDWLGIRDSTTATPGPGQSQCCNRQTTGDKVVGAGSAEPYTGSSTVTMSWTMTDQRKWALGAVALKPAPVAVTPLTVVKSSQTFSDPFNGTTNPKAIPGAFVTYSINVNNPAATPVDANTVIITEAVPASTDMFVGDVGGGGSGPIVFINGVPSSGLTYTFTSLASATDDVSFSNNGGATFSYTPAPDVNGVDSAVTHVRINPKGTFNALSGFQVQFRVRVE